MKISLLGHSCFLIELATGTRIITDPYQHCAFSGSLKYLPVEESADIVTISHHHADHNLSSGFAGAKVLDSAGKWRIKDVDIKTIVSYHDKFQGRRRGENLIFVIRAQGLKLVHFGDLGTMDLDYSLFKNVDIAMVPVGGVFTIDYREAATLLDRIKPGIFIPMHFKTPKLDFDIDQVDKFIAGKNNVVRAESITIAKDTLPPATKIVVLSYLR